MKNKPIGIALAILLILALAAIAWLGCVNREKREAFDAMAAEVAALEAQVAELAAENDGLTAENESLAAEIASAEEVNAALEAEVSSLGAAVESGAAEVAELTGEIAALEADVAAYEAELAGLQDSDQTDTLNATVLELTEALDAAGARIAELEALLPALTTPAEAAQTRVTVPDDIAVASDGVSAAIAFRNENESYFAVRVLLVVNGVTVYESDALAPGAELGDVTLTGQLASGEHAGYLVWEARDDKGELISSSMASVRVSVE